MLFKIFTRTSYLFRCYRILLYNDGKQIEVETPYLLDTKTFDVDISIVVPAYNEEARLPVMMKDTLEVRNL